MTPVLIPADTPLLDDGSKSPTDWPDSPIHCYKLDQMIRFGHYGDGNMDGRPDSTCGAYDGSGITGSQVKYSLVEAIDGAIFYERAYFYAHVNFYAIARNGPKKNGPKVLVFAELQHVGRRLNAMALRSFHFLDEKKQTVGRRDLARGSHTSQDRDLYHCYACTDRIKHPEGSSYKTGHYLDE